MSFGLIDSRASGRRCISIRVFSRVNVGLIVCMWLVGLPRCVVISIDSEYMDVMVMLSPRSAIVILDHKIIGVITNSSPIRLIVGGRARLARFARSHHSAIRGRRV